MNTIHRVLFFWDFIRKNKTDNCFNEIYYNNTLLNKNTNANNLDPKVINISLFPSYLKPVIINENDYYLKKIKHFGFSSAGIIIDEKSKLKKTIQRLEESFDISYKYYYGEITPEKCDFLLNILHEMLKKRFNQKQIENNYILFWEEYIKDIYTLINKKKASLFVAYDKNKPINISLNYHISDTIMHSEINAFDIDYI